MIEEREVELSIVIPVYNGAASIASLVDRIHRVFHSLRFEIILVNDGSRDPSETVCSRLVDAYPDTVRFLHLSRNFGEHNAVLAGLNYARGDYVGVLDDDGQNPPEELLRLWEAIQAEGHDVIYGRYRVKRHGLLRNLGSWFADRMANIMLKKPPGLYLSSFKVMNRFAVNEVIKYRGPFPYIDGLIYRSTNSIGQLDVEHRDREHGASNYTFGKLVRLWSNMFLSFSILPLRIVTWTGFLFAVASLFALVIIWINKFRLEENPTPGFPTLLCCVIFFGGLNLLVAGMLGEYLGRLSLAQSGTPQFVIRYAKRSGRGSPDVDASPGESAQPGSEESTPSLTIPMEILGAVRRPGAVLSRDH